MQYSDNLTVIVPDFYTVTDPNPRAFSNQLVFMSAFATLRALRQPDGSIRFHECIEVDSDGSRSIELLANLAEQLEPDTTLAGWRLDDDVASMVRLPRDSEHELDGKEPLMRIGLALGQQPIDIGWFDDDGGLRIIQKIAAEHGVDGLGNPSLTNPAQVQARLSARAAAIWLAIADQLIPTGPDRRKAFASFDHFNSKGERKTA